MSIIPSNLVPSTQIRKAKKQEINDRERDNSVTLQHTRTKQEETNFCPTSKSIQYPRFGFITSDLS